MKSTYKTIIVLITALISCCLSGEQVVNGQQTGSYEYFGQTPPGNVPKRFPPDYLLANAQWFYHGTPSFSKDLKEMYWVAYTPSATVSGRINCIKYSGNSWGSPFVPQFALPDFFSNNPILSFSNDTMYFISHRSNGFLFFSVRQGSGWSPGVPVAISLPANRGAGPQFAIAKNRNIYIESASLTGNTKDEIYFAEYKNNTYSMAIPFVRANSSSSVESTLFVDPNENFLIFASDRTADNFGDNDLFIVFKDYFGRWIGPYNMGPSINTAGPELWPYVTPDGKYLFFNSIRSGDTLGFNPYWVSSQVIDSLRSVALGKDEIKVGYSMNQNYPNPFINETTFSFSLKDPGNIAIVIYDVSGKKIDSAVDQAFFCAGDHTVSYSGKALPKGNYTFCLLCEGQLLSSKSMCKAD